MGVPLSTRQLSDLYVRSALISPLRAGIGKILPDLKLKMLYDYAEVYDLAYKGHKGDIQFYKEQSQHGRTLYLGVGTGRIFSKLVENNPNIFGVDNSQAMISLMLKKHSQVPKNQIIFCNIFTADFEENSYDTIIAPFSFLTQFSQEQAICILTLIRKWLKPEGKFVTDFFSPFRNPIAKKVETKSKRLSSRKRIKTYFIYDHIKQELAEYTLVTTKEETLLLELKLNYFYPRELIKMSHQTNFVVEKMAGGFKGEALTVNSGVIVLILRK